MMYSGILCRGAVTQMFSSFDLRRIIECLHKLKIHQIYASYTSFTACNSSSVKYY